MALQARRPSPRRDCPSPARATIVSISAWVGLTLPGMIELPGSFSGSFSSPRPERGPEPSRRMSLAILVSDTAMVFSMPDSSTIVSWAASSANLFGRCERQARKVGDLLGEGLGKALRCVEPGADGRPTLGQAIDSRQHAFDPLDIVRELLGVTGEFLSERERRRVLQMRAADLDDLVPARLRPAGRASSSSAGKSRALIARAADDVERSREAVVRRLALVHVIVRVNRLLAAALARQLLVGAPRDHLVGVHVGLRARAGLPDDERELAVEIAPGDLRGRLLDRFGNLRLQTADPGVHPRRRLLDEPQGMDDLERHLLARTEREIPDRPFGLSAPIGVRADFNRAEAVGFGTGAVA